MIRKIAVVTQDQHKVSIHFGMAPYYQVFSIEDGKITAEETRQKPHHEHHPDHNSDQHEHDHGNGHPQKMFAPLADCQVLICGGMGSPAFAKAQAAGLEVILTGGEIQASVQAYLDGKIVSDLLRVHAH